MSKAFEKNIPWIEKYRPNTLNDIVGNKQIILRLKTISNEQNIPHLLLSGPSGTEIKQVVYIVYQKKY